MLGVLRLKILRKWRAYSQDHLFDFAPTLSLSWVLHQHRPSNFPHLLFRGLPREAPLDGGIEHVILGDDSSSFGSLLESLLFV